MSVPAGPGPVEDAMIARLASEPARTAILLDFDGTLAPIVANPERSQPVDGAADVLAELGARYGLVAVISGRPVATLRAHLGTAPGVRLAGLYGIEHLVDGSLQVHRDAARQRDAVADAADELERTFADAAGVYIERKGLSVAVHFRRAPDPPAAQAAGDPAVRAVAARTGLGAIRPGRLVLEIGPAVDVDKGSVARALLAETGVGAALAAGDDAGDVALFRALDGLAPALRIAVVSDETPPALLASADATVAGPPELLSILSALARGPGP